MKRLLGVCLLVATVGACRVREPEPVCNDTSIKGFFFLADGSGSFTKVWDKVLPFVEQFKNTLSSTLPIWLMQWSSTHDYCLLLHNKNTSWECYGDEDPCRGGSILNDKCPPTHVTHLEPGWTKEQFDKAADTVFAKNQNGWTRPFHFIGESADAWKQYKESHGLGPNDRALLVMMTDGEVNDAENVPNVTQKFKDVNMKFFGVYKKLQYSFGYYFPLMDQKTDVIEMTDDDLNTDFAERIIDGACNGNTVVLNT